MQRFASLPSAVLLASALAAQPTELTVAQETELAANCAEFVATALQIPASSVLVSTDHYNDILGDFCDDSYHGPYFDRFVSARGEDTKYSADSVEFLRRLYCRGSTGAFWEGYYEFRDAQDPRMVWLYASCERLGLHWNQELRYGVRVAMAVAPNPRNLSLVFTLVDQQSPSGPPTVLRLEDSASGNCLWRSADTTASTQRKLPATDYALQALGQTATLKCLRSDGQRRPSSVGPESVSVSWLDAGERLVLAVPWPR